MCYKYLTCLTVYNRKRILTYQMFLVLLSTVFLYSYIDISKLVKSNFFNPNVIDLLPITTVSSSPLESSIFFHETSGKGTLNSRQACAIESAAKTHPNWRINALFLGSARNVTVNITCVTALKKYPNIQFFRLNLTEYAAGTPLESLIREGKLNKSRWQISHTSDALRFLSLYKWGGVYLDLDVIVAKSFEDLAPNWGARESGTSVAAGAISFSLDKLGREVAADAIKNFKDNYRGDIWGHNGPGVMTRILKKMCRTSTVTKMTASRCKGFEVYGPELFYPVSWPRAKDYFSEKKLDLGHPYIYHIWNMHTKSYTVKETSVYAQLAQQYCPEVYKAYNSHFGT